jgi:hypothetical protein
MFKYRYGVCLELKSRKPVDFISCVLLHWCTAWCLRSKIEHRLGFFVNRELRKRHREIESGDGTEL